MSAPIPTIAVRLALGTASNPPVTPLDQNTGLAPQAYRSMGLAVQAAVFDAYGNPVDISDLLYMQAVLMPSSTALYSVATVNVLASAIVGLITSNGWQTGQEQNATFNFTAAQMDQSLNAEISADYWLVIQGMTSTGNLITFGAGPLTLFNPGNSLPIPVSNAVGFNEQTNTTGNFLVKPKSQNDIQIVDLAGTAGARPGVIGTINVEAGAQMKLIFNLPNTAGIVVSLFSGSLTGAAILPGFTTPGGSFIPQAVYDLYFDGTKWNQLTYTGPL